MDDVAKVELGGVEVTLCRATDGAVVVWIDTPFEPDCFNLRVNVNDGGVFGYDEVQGQLKYLVGRRTG